MLLITQNANNNKLLNETKSEKNITEQKLKEQSSELSEYKIRASQLEENNSILESKIKQIEEKSKHSKIAKKF